jgi:quercetin dioxygenase-like cupin family protein
MLRLAVRASFNNLDSMDTSRRELNLWLPALLAAAHTTAAAGQKNEAVLPSKCYPFESLPVKKNAQNGNETRQVFTGATHEGYPIDLHITTLQPGQMPHPEHTHVHEEMIMIQTGTLEVTITGQATRIGPGSVAYVKSNEKHGWKNVGNTPATYFVLAIGRQQNNT